MKKIMLFALLLSFLGIENLFGVEMEYTDVINTLEPKVEIINTQVSKEKLFDTVRHYLILNYNDAASTMHNVIDNSMISFTMRKTIQHSVSGKPYEGFERFSVYVEFVDGKMRITFAEPEVILNTVDGRYKPFEDFLPYNSWTMRNEYIDGPYWNGTIDVKELRRPASKIYQAAWEDFIKAMKDIASGAINNSW